jgi:hypothetical protein
MPKVPSISDLLYGDPQVKRVNMGNTPMSIAEMMAANQPGLASYRDVSKDAERYNKGHFGTALATGYINKKIADNAAEDAAAKRKDFLDNVPTNPTAAQGGGPPDPNLQSDVAKYYQMGPTEDLQKTGNKMADALLFPEAKAPITPHTAVVGVEGNPGLKQQQVYDPETNTWSNLGPAYGALESQRAGAQEQRAVEDQAMQKQAQQRQAEIDKKNAVNQEQQYQQQQYQNNKDVFNTNNPNYKSDQDEIKAAEKEHEQLVQNIDYYQKVLEEADKTVGGRHNPMINAKLQAARAAIDWAVRSKNMQNTGVMNTGELPALRQVITDPTAWTPSGFRSVDELKGQLGEIKGISKRGLDALKGSKKVIGELPKPPAPTARERFDSNRPSLRGESNSANPTTNEAPVYERQVINGVAMRRRVK